MFKICFNFLLSLSLIGLYSCGNSGGSGNVTVNIATASINSSLAVKTDIETVNKVKTNTLAAGCPALVGSPSFASGWINSGTPDYIKITLTGISVTFSGGNTKQLWTGEKQLTIDGNAVDISDINGQLQDVGTGTVTSVSTTFKAAGKIKGCISGLFNLTTGVSAGTQSIFCTKAAYPYNAVTHTGGTASYTSFSASSVTAGEETDVSFSSEESLTVETTANYEIQSGVKPTLTILFDINRLLRFYDGLNPSLSHGGVNPTDPSNAAYFFAHSLLGKFVAGFFGTPGRIEGYKTFYSASTNGGASYEGVEGWLTVVYDSNGTFLSGIMMGNDDNALTCAKGIITTYTSTATNTATFRYDISNVEVTGFTRQTTIGNCAQASIASFAANVGGGTSQTFTGQADFQLIFTQ